MASLHITPLGGGEYEFEASGCRLSYFVIWNDGETPTPDKWYPVDEDSNYNSMTKYMDSNRGINFQVYYGISDYKGGKYLPPSYNDNDNDSSSNEEVL